MSLEVETALSCDWPYDAFGSPAFPQVVFLHGSFGTAEDWNDIAEGLSDAFYCIVPDLPGHGRNTLRPVDEPLEFETVCAELITFLKSLSDRPTALVGYSLGGRLALAAALHDAACCSALVLESASPGIESSAARGKRAEADRLGAEEIAQKGLKLFFEKWYRLPVFASLRRHPEVMSAMMEKRLSISARWASKCLEELSPGLQPNLRPKLPGLKMPTLFLAGECDEKFSALASAMASEAFSGEYRSIDDAGHNVHLEQPWAFSQEIRAFLAPLLATAAES